MPSELKLCIINGYPQSSRAKLDAAHVIQAHDLYINFFKAYTPDAQIDLFYVADVENPLPAAMTPCAPTTASSGPAPTSPSTTSKTSTVTRQIELCRAIFQAGIPQFGSCWGVQMAAVAAGGEVQKNPQGREWGIAPHIRLTEAGRKSPLMAGKPDMFSGFIMHLDEVTRIPAGGTLLAEGEHTRVQALAVRHGNGIFWATQYHPEYVLYEMAQLIGARARPLVNEGFFENEADVQAHAAALKQLANDPENAELRATLGIGDDILGADIRQQELRNWIDHLVCPRRSA